MLPEEEAFTIKSVHNTEAGGRRFIDLPNDMKQRILDYEFFVHVLPSNVSDREILEIFSRMNSTGYKLKLQELRNAQFYGEFKTIVYNLGLQYYDKWLKWGVFTDAKISRMDEMELVNDLLISVIDGIARRSPEAIDSYYKRYDETGSLKHKDEIINRVRNTLDYLETVVGDDIKQTQFYKVPLFYALYNVLYDLRLGHNSRLVKKTPFKIPNDILKDNIIRTSRLIENHKVPEKVFISFTKGTNTVNARTNVFNFLKKELSHGY